MNSKSRLALVATMLLAGTALSSPARADGGAGGDSGSSAVPFIPVFSGGTGATGTNGGAGGAGSASGAFQNTGGGGGGGGAAGGGQGGAGGTTTMSAGGAGGAAGATGGDGENGSAFGVEGGGGGGGGGGGNHGFSGAALAGAASGGNGGNGGRGGESSSGAGAMGGGGGGGGGAGGYGAIVTGATVNSNALLIAGGNGGAGGAGGTGGNAFSVAGVQGNGGDGGVGVEFSTGGATFTNTGNVAGGAGGTGAVNGAGGAAIVGSGVTIINSGTITGGLSGDGVTRANAITFAGGGNTLELRAGFVITGNVAVSGADAFRLGGAVDSSFDISSVGAGQQYQEFGGYSKTGASTWTLTGTTTATGAWSVDAGTLAVNGDIRTSTGVTVNNGGTLGGTGFVGNTTIANGGTLAPGNSIGTLSVAGNLTFVAGSNYAIEVSPADADRTNVSGTATLTGAMVNATYAAGGYVARQYTILNATGGGIGGGNVFASLSNTNLPGNVTAALGYDANNVYLNLTLAYAAPGGGLNSNQQNAANALTNYFNSTGGIPTAFASLNASGLSQVAGEPGAGAQQSVLTGAGLFMNNVFDNAFSNPVGGPGGGALGYASQRKVSSAAQQAYAAVTPRGLAPAYEQRWTMWASGYGGSARVSGDSAAGSHDTTSRVYGAAVGATWRAANTQLGFALGGSGSTFGIAEGFGGGKADAFNAALYAHHAFGSAYIAAALGYSWQDASTGRTVSAGGVTDVLHASFRPQALSARLEGGWRYATPALGITPYAALQTTAFFLPSYGETAMSGLGTFALSYASKNVTATRSELGAKFDKAMLVQTGVFTLKAKAAWAHDWNNERSATATFQQLPGATFTVNGAQPAADSALLSLGAEMTWHNGWAVSAAADGEFSRTTASYSGKGGVKYAW